MPDKNNFEFKLGKWHIVMADGELEINKVGYEETDDDPTYDKAILIWSDKCHAV